MKKITTFLYISLLIFSLQNLLYAADTQSAEISKIENEIFGFDYTKDTLTNRVDRLEKSIYGSVNKGNINNRIEKLAKDLSVEEIGKEITPTEDTFKEQEEIADNSVSYPIIDDIEKQLFNKIYTNKDFHSRIVGIERKIFGKIYDIDDYSTRMERIKSKMYPNKVATSEPELRDYTNTGLSSTNEINKAKNLFTSHFGQKNYTRPYANYGEGINEFAPPNDIQDELAKLEYDTFGTEFSNDDTKTRIKRLNSVNKAKKSSKKYDSQKFQQHMSTAMEIGAMLLMILALVL